MDSENPPEELADDGVLLTMADVPTVAWLLSIRPRNASPPPEGMVDGYADAPAQPTQLDLPQDPFSSGFAMNQRADLPPVSPETLRDPTRWANASVGLDLPPPARSVAAPVAFDALGRDGRPVDIEVRTSDLPNWPMPRPAVDPGIAPRTEPRPNPVWRDQIEQTVPVVRDARPVEVPGRPSSVLRQGVLPSPPKGPSRPQMADPTTRLDLLLGNPGGGPMRASLPTPLGVRRQGPLF